MLEPLKAPVRRVSTFEQWDQHELYMLDQKKHREAVDRRKQVYSIYAKAQEARRRHACWLLVALILLGTAVYGLLSKGLLPHLQVPFGYRAVTDWMLTEDFQVRFTYGLLGASITFAALEAKRMVRCWRHMKCAQHELRQITSKLTAR